jgi:Thioesterase-like superfamily
MTGLAELLLSADPVTDGRALTVPEIWHQGRTAYGGFTSALALAEAMRAGGPELSPLRSAQFAMMAPLAGRLEVRARVLRRGRNATWIAAEVSGEKDVGFTASFVFMKPVDSVLAIDQAAVPSAVLPVDEAPPVPGERGPVFLTENFDVRHGSAEGANAQGVLWWMRPRDHETLDPTVALMLTADGAPPSVLMQLPERVPLSTMHWHVNVLSARPQTHDGWWLLHSSTGHAANGLSSERMAAWNSRLEPMLAELQSVAVFG